MGRRDGNRSVRRGVRVRILIGDVLERLADLPDESVQCVVTSPPYWGLRDYGVEGQIGLEESPDAYVAKMVEVFAEVRRVLRDDGTVWLNLGDSYNSIGHKKSSSGYGTTGLAGGIAQHATPLRRENSNLTLKHKDLCMIPARVAMALQADGWWLRSEIVWAKPNPMPESVTDRPTSSHEKIFLLAKLQRYYFDAEAVRRPLAPTSIVRYGEDIDNQNGSLRAHGGMKTDGPMKAVGGPRRSDKQRGHSRRHDGFNDRWGAMSKEEQQSMGANIRNVWNVATHAYSEAHFATFPPALIEPCIKAGCPEGGTVLDTFGGAGTTGMVADRLGRNAILIELNPEYAEIARARIAKDGGMFSEVEAA
jgi:DNA modification methylase